LPSLPTLPGAAQVLPLLKDRPIIWVQLNSLNCKALPGAMFGGLYFDWDGTLTSVSIYSSFDNTTKRLV
jgi:hypothetical protein